MNAEEKLEELLLRWEELAEAGRQVSAEELCQDCPELTGELRRRIDGLMEMGWVSRLQNMKGSTIVLVPNGEPVPGYRLVRQVGKGGFAVVWLATGPDGSAVALKFIPWVERAASVEWHAIRHRQCRQREPRPLLRRADSYRAGYSRGTLQERIRSDGRFRARRGSGAYLRCREDGRRESSRPERAWQPRSHGEHHDYGRQAVRRFAEPYLVVACPSDVTF